MYKKFLTFVEDLNQISRADQSRQSILFPRKNQSMVYTLFQVHTLKSVSEKGLRYPFSFYSTEDTIILSFRVLGNVVTK
ncbi:AMP_1a_G0000040.mRNA.1.CDS.1 [Saccharomyces cerevisiae]|nr:AMP_1a_G0000040.mRNA.1.CDS.1 [Saccharomyces cerevisiae]CAI6465682.1 AMP_1a_G0000040.mRNA.1.CDS.1 [Saccharomyces cerevisiae]